MAVFLYFWDAGTDEVLQWEFIQRKLKEWTLKHCEGHTILEKRGQNALLSISGVSFSRLNSLSTWMLKLKRSSGLCGWAVRTTVKASCFLHCVIFVGFILSPSLLVIMSVVIVQRLGFHSLFLEHVHPSDNISSVLNHWHMMHVGAQVVSCLCWFVRRFMCIFILW